LELGPLKIHAYGLALAMAFLIGSIWVTRRGHRLGYREDELSRLFLWILGSALIGARMYYAFQHPEDFRDDWLEVMQVWRGGLTQHGGIIAALLVGWLFVRSREWAFRGTSDLIAPALALGEGITRIGCFLNGCCFGHPTDLSWGVVYPENSSAHWALGSQSLHPSQLYLSVANFLLFIFLARVMRPLSGTGRVFAAFLVASSVIRFLIDFTRYYTESDYLVIAGIRLIHSQWIGILLVVLALVLWFRPARVASPDHVPGAE
jgi:phosphatidylglycerol:prolipoprotein diacylglycerol transferase